MSEIYNDTAVNQILGCFINDNTLIKSTKYKLDKNDFKIKIHEILFVALYNLSNRRCNSPTYLDIITMIKNNESAYNTFMREIDNPESYIDTIKNLADIENIDYYYDSVRKMSLLRDIYDEGDNLLPFWDIDKSDEKNLSNIENFTVDDILRELESRMLDKRRKYSKDDEDTKRKKAGYNGIEIFHSFKKKSRIQAQFEGKYETTLFGGFNKKQLYIRSSDTSGGKSRSIVGDIASVTLRELYDKEQGRWMENLNGGHSALYIGAEMDLDEEVDPLFDAYASDVESSIITDGLTTEKEDLIIERAIKNKFEQDLYLTDMPSFNIEKIRREVAYYKKHCNIEYLGFDYMLLNNAMVKEFVNERGKGVAMRGDEILLELSKSLKDICKEFDIGIITATQTNADIKDFRMRDYQVLRGGKAVADKATGGSIAMPITDGEYKLVEPIINKLIKERKLRFDFGSDPMDKQSLFVETIYKSRFSRYPKECKIFYIYNLGTMRKKELFVTNKDFQPINVKKHEY